MPRKAKKAGRPRSEPFQTFAFEIGKWRPTYSLSIDRSKYRSGPYSEHAQIEFEAPCIHPQQFQGRIAEFNFWGDRNSLTPSILEREPEWVPNCVGMLELSPTRGHFYTSLPHDSLTFVLSAFEHGLFRFILLYGQALKRSRSPCFSLRLASFIDSDDL